MKKTTRIATLVAAATLALPLVASAAPERPAFPMEGDTFLEHVEGRLAKAKERIEASSMPAEKKAKVLSRLEDRSGAILKAAAAAAADGTVTKEEARQLRAQGKKAKRGEKGKRGKKGKRGGAERPSFPMDGDAFVAAAEKRVAAHRARLVERLERRGVDAEAKAEALARHDARSAKILEGARAAAADGTVTKEEARALRQELRKAKRKHREGKGDRARRGGERRGEGKGDRARRGKGPRGEGRGPRG